MSIFFVLCLGGRGPVALDPEGFISYPLEAYIIQRLPIHWLDLATLIQSALCHQCDGLIDGSTEHPAVLQSSDQCYALV